MTPLHGQAEHDPVIAITAVSSGGRFIYYSADRRGLAAMDHFAIFSYNGRQARGR